MTKTTTLTGTEVCVKDLGGQNVAVQNLSDGTIWASAYPHVVAGADDVYEIPAGGGVVVLDARGTVYLLGTGKVQCTGTPYATPNFKLPSSSKGGGGDKNSDYICGQAEFITDLDDIKTIEIETFSISAFAAALANETGWVLRSNGVVLCDDKVGFQIGNLDSYVWLANSKGGQASSNFKYMESTTAPYCFDICKNPNGTVWAFGFRSKQSNINLSFILSADLDGNLVSLSSYTNYTVYSVRVNQTASQIDTSCGIARTSYAPTALSNLRIVGGTIELPDVFLMYSCNRWPSSGDGFVVNGETFRIVRNRCYDNTPTLAIRTKSKKAL